MTIGRRTETPSNTAACESAVIFDKDNAPDNGAWARAILARSLLGEGKVAEAQTIAAKAAVLSKHSATQAARFEAVLADSRAQERSGNTAEASKELTEMLASAQKSGYRSFEYQARLTLAEIQFQSHPAVARQQLVLLAKDAKAQHLLLIARHAESLLQGQ